MVFINEQEWESAAWGAAHWSPKTADVQAVRLADARRWAMSILAACRWQDARRRPDLRVEPIPTE